MWKIVFTILCLLLIGCEKQENIPIAPPAIPAIAIKPSIKDVTDYIETTGVLAPSMYVEIRPQVHGTVQEIYISEGEQVEKGQPLFRIDPKPYQLAVQEAKAQMNRDRAQLEAAHKKLERYRSLVEKDLISLTEWDELEAQAAQAKAQLEADEARLGVAKLNLNDCMIHSPIAGRVGKLDIYPGVWIKAQDLLASLSNMDPLILEFYVTEQEAAKLINMQNRVEIQSLCNKKECWKPGEITFIDNQYDAQSGLLLLRGKVENASGTLRPGQSIGVRLPVALNKQQKLIPQKALKYNQDGSYVYIVKPDQSVELRPITLGDAIGKEMIVLNGLDVDELVITDGHLRLYPGAKVNIEAK